MKIVRYLWILLCLLCYASVLISPRIFPFGALLGYAIPVIVVISLFILLISRKLWSLIIPIASIPFTVATFQFSTPTPPSEDSFTVLSFNAKLFRRPGSYREFSTEMIEWTAADTADIKVIPEHSTDDRWATIDVNKRIGDHGYNAFSVSAPIDDNDHNLGSAIFSRFPSAQKGTVFTDSTSVSMTIFEDVVIGKDTVRIYNVHLASMRLAGVQLTGRFSKLRTICNRLMAGAVMHSSQVDTIVAHIEECRYPYIICGDFNETPYSYSYWRMRRLGTDAFIDEGIGFGFTFESLHPLARIDYQFVSDEIVVETIDVEKHMRLSDHLPLRGRYRVSK